MLMVGERKYLKMANSERGLKEVGGIIGWGGVGEEEEFSQELIQEDELKYK